jgi:hypothetical protein
MCQNQCKVIKRENAIMKNEKMFLYFLYKENKMQGLNSNFHIQTLLQAKRDKSSRILRRKHSDQCARTTNEKDDKKEYPKNSTIRRFPITL